MFEKSAFETRRWFCERVGALLGSFVKLWGSLRSSLGPLDRPQKASRFLLELSWASSAGPENVPGPLWDRLWCSKGPVGRCLATCRTDFDLQN